MIAHNRGHHPDAADLLAQAHTTFVEIAGARSLEVATVESALGSVARAVGDLDTAERWHKSALAIDREQRGPSHPDIARDLHNLAGVLRLRGDLDAAATSYREALAIEVATKGPRSIEAGLTHNSLGLVHMTRGEWQGARAELSIARELLGAAGHGDRAFADHNLGLVAAALGDHAGALIHYLHAAELYATTIGDHSDAASRLATDRVRSEAMLGRSSISRARVRKAADQKASDPAAAVSTAAIPKPADPTAADPKAAAPNPADPKSVAPKGAVPTVAPRKHRDVGVYGSTQPW